MRVPDKSRLKINLPGIDHNEGGSMPTPEQILSGLSRISNDWQILAIIWHIYFLLIAAALISGYRPSKKLTGILLSLPVFSVSILAWWYGILFNGLIYAVIGILLIIISIRISSENVSFGSLWIVVPGILLFLFGWVYPHFSVASSLPIYVYAAPTGLIPCPTLSIVIGLSLILNNFGSKSWALILGVAGMFYGVFGAARLGVTIDLILLLGAIIITITAFQYENKGSREPALGDS